MYISTKDKDYMIYEIKNINILNRN